MTRRRKIILVIGAVAASLLAFMPLRVALGLFGPDALTSARAQGSIWHGRLDHAAIGAMALGTIDVGVKPLPLLAGRVSLSAERLNENGGADPLTGTFYTGIGGRGVADLSGIIGTLSTDMLPPMRIEAQQLSVQFSGAGCSAASGRVRTLFAADIAGLSLRNGLSGDVRCDGEALLVPLAGESGLEKLTLRLWPDGRYTARITVTATDPTLSSALAAAGFAPSAEGFIRTMEGRF